MNRIDDILERLQQQPLPEIVNPDELTDSIMDSLPDRHRDTPSPADGRQRRQVWLYVASALSAAACIALLMVLHFGGKADGGVVAERQMPVRHEVTAARNVATIETVKVAQTTQKPDVATKAEHQLAAQPKASSAEYQSAVQPSALSSEQPSGQPAAMTAETTLATAEPAATNADSMAIMAARMESEMQRISDECYMSHLSRVIDSNPQLKRLVDDFISETGKGANTSVCVKEM